MNYGNYGGDYRNDRRGSYGRRTRDSRGRYTARGGRGRYRGGDRLDDMRDMYDEYTDMKEEYGRGNYGAKGESLRQLDEMLQGITEFIECLKEEADSEEEMDLIQKYSRKISEM